MTIETHFTRFLKAQVPDVFSQESIAVAVSGGGDSMALAYTLTEVLPDHDIHFLTVDHGLRPESAEEAQTVKEWVSEAGHHETLVWSHDGVDSKLQEQARDARYQLMCDYCKSHDIQTLFVGHNQDDLIETFLMRLSSGSGLDGLSSIAPISTTHDVTIVRPFYETSHEDLLNHCRENDVSWIEDPSNDKDDYKRVRFRKAQEFMEEEGLTPKRLSKTIARMSRARDALDSMVGLLFDGCVTGQTGEAVSLDYQVFLAMHAEFQHRVLVHIIQVLAPKDGYPPRLEKLEGLVFDLGRDAPFRKRSFAGCLFEVKAKDNLFMISKENR